MKSFKGFAQIGALADNVRDQVAPVGELAALSRTFTRDQTIHTSGANPGYALVGFSYYESDKVVQFTDEAALQILSVVDWTYGKARLGTFNSDITKFRNTWLADLGATYDLQEVGSMVQFDNTKYAPSFIIFNPKNEVDVSWKVWFSNDAFFNQFDETELNHVKPLLNLDDFFLDYVNLKPLLDARTLSDSISQVDVLRGVDPETRLRVDPFDWVDKIDRNRKISVDWMTLIYGEAGNNLDSVKESLGAWILKNSKHSRDDWSEIFPDIFTSTEFILIPMWNEFSVPPTDRQHAIYSGASNMLRGIAKAQKLCKGVKYTPLHISNVSSALPTQFKSLMCVVVGGPENRDGKVNFADQYPDWMNVPTTHVDFGKMSERTKGAYMMLAEMLEFAETMTATTAAPVGYNRTVRDGVMYLTKTYQKFLHLVVTKYSYDLTIT